jgi:hypothetical protein
VRFDATRSLWRGKAAFHGLPPPRTCAVRRAVLEEAIMFRLRLISRFLLRAGSLQASPIASGVRRA